MSNSSLVTYTCLSPNHSNGRRGNRISKITPHYMAGDLTVETCGNVFLPTSRQASSNYGIGSDGRVALYVDESNRAWTSASAANDNVAVTIECANKADSSLTDACWASLVELCADICRRNGIEALSWTGDKSGNLTVHRMFASTSCPGEWMMAHMQDLADQVNDKLNGKEERHIVAIAAIDNAVYRLYDPNSGDHMFTASADEANSLQSAGWTYEGVAFSCDPNESVAVYRLYNPNSGDHMFTASHDEAQSLSDAGWNDEGIAFYAAKA